MFNPAAVTLSLAKDGTITLPSAACAAVGLRPGQQVELDVIGHRIELMPITDIRAMRGLLRGIDTEITRDDDRF